MSRGGKILLAIVGLIAIGVLGYKWRYPTYSWHQKLTIAVETPDGVVSGSSVVGVKVVYQPTLGFSEIKGISYQWQGEAAVVELPGERYIFGLLAHPAYRAQKVFKKSIMRNPEAQFPGISYARLSRLRQTAPVPSGSYPLLVTFGDINDPKTASGWTRMIWIRPSGALPPWQGKALQEPPARERAMSRMAHRNRNNATS